MMYVIWNRYIYSHGKKINLKKSKKNRARICLKYVCVLANKYSYQLLF